MSFLNSKNKVTIPNDWQIKPVGSICDFIVPGRNKPTKYLGDIPWITTPDIEGNIEVGFSKSNLKITKEEAKSIGSKIVPKNSIIISCVGDLGVTAISGNDLVINQQLHAFLPRDQIHFRFLYYALGIQKPFMEMIATKTSVPYMNKDNCNSIPVIFPPLPEQKAIAAVLSLMDSAINKTNQLIAQKELQKKALMHKLLRGKKRLQGFDGVWIEVRLGEIFNRVTRKNIEVNTNVVTISAKNGFVRQGDYFNKIVASDILDNYFLVEKGEFCYNKSYSNGYPWGATKRLNDFEKAVVTTLYICFRIKNEFNTDGAFFEQFFESGALEEGLTKIAHEGGRAHGLLNVTPTDFFNICINVPSHSEQTAIAKVLQSADKEIQLLKSKAEKLKEQKKGMMQVLLTGKKRLKGFQQ